MHTLITNLQPTGRQLLASLFVVLCLCCLSGCGRSHYERANEAATKKDWYGAKKLLEEIRSDESDFTKAQELLRTVRHELASVNFIKAKGINPTLSNWALLDNLLKDFPKEHPNYNDSRVMLDQYYFPAATGDKWEYTFDMSGGNAELDSINRKIAGSSTFTTTVEVTDSLEEGFLFVSTTYIGNFFPVKQQFVYQFRNDMIMEAAAGGGIPSTPLTEHARKPILLKLPITVGSRWDYKNEKEYTISLEITKLYDSLEVENTLYRNVVEVKRVDPELTIPNGYFYYAYKIGLIAKASEFHDRFNKDSETFEKDFTDHLKRYSVR